MQRWGKIQPAGEGTGPAMGLRWKRAKGPQWHSPREVMCTVHRQAPSGKSCPKRRRNCEKFGSDCSWSPSHSSVRGAGTAPVHTHPSWGCPELTGLLLCLLHHGSEVLEAPGDAENPSRALPSLLASPGARGGGRARPRIADGKKMKSWPPGHVEAQKVLEEQGQHGEAEGSGRLGPCTALVSAAPGA